MPDELARPSLAYRPHQEAHLGRPGPLHIAISHKSVRTLQLWSVKESPMHRLVDMYKLLWEQRFTWRARGSHCLRTNDIVRSSFSRRPDSAARQQAHTLAQDGQMDQVGPPESSAYSSEQRRMILKGHRILARVAIRAHLQRQLSPEPHGHQSREGGTGPERTRTQGDGVEPSTG